MSNKKNSATNSNSVNSSLIARIAESKAKKHDAHQECAWLDPGDIPACAETYAGHTLRLTGMRGFFDCDGRFEDGMEVGGFNIVSYLLGNVRHPEDEGMPGKTPYARALIGRKDVMSDGHEMIVVDVEYSDNAVFLRDDGLVIWGARIDGFRNRALGGSIIKGGKGDPDAAPKAGKPADANGAAEKAADNEPCVLKASDEKIGGYPRRIETTDGHVYELESGLNEKGLLDVLVDGAMINDVLPRDYLNGTIDAKGNYLWTVRQAHVGETQTITLEKGGEKVFEKAFEITAFRNKYDVDMLVNGEIATHRRYDAFRKCEAMSDREHAEKKARAELAAAARLQKAKAKAVPAIGISTAELHDINEAFAKAVMEGLKDRPAKPIAKPAAKPVKDGHAAETKLAARILSEKKQLVKKKTMRSGRTVRLVNFRSWDDCDFRFSDGVLLKHAHYGLYLYGNLQHPDDVCVLSPHIGKIVEISGVKACVADARNSKDATIFVNDGRVFEHRRIPYPKKSKGRNGSEKKGSKNTAITILDMTPDIAKALLEGSKLKRTHKA